MPTSYDVNTYWPTIDWQDLKDAVTLVTETSADDVYECVESFETLNCTNDDGTERFYEFILKYRVANGILISHHTMDGTVIAWYERQHVEMPYPDNDALRDIFQRLKHGFARETPCPAGN